MVGMDPEAAFTAYMGARLAHWSRLAFLLTGDRHQAEDLVQVTFERVARRWERVAADGDPDPYVRRTMLSQHVSLWRRRWRNVELWARPPEPPTGDPTAATDRAVVVRQALARLAPRQRSALVLRYFEDLTEVETARVLNCSVSTVKSQVRDGLARLRALAPELGELITGGQR
ncbi:RNA polymerase sigma factor [Virgisporangium aurantiacum]|uniref:RNA polymerase sigma factor n=2 Tax=Virgisporangium aurantiacum TaxID=175570 RepID=A0A8J3Z101_9ACTN|nr:RNA polymerase sigma factor [Virgisporangium aurantiacum]